MGVKAERTKTRPINLPRAYGWRYLHGNLLDGRFCIPPCEWWMSSVANYFLLQLSNPAGGSQLSDIAFEIITAARGGIKATEACARVAAVA